MTPLSFALAHSLPEIVLAVGALALLMLGALRKLTGDWIISECAIVLLGLAALSMLFQVQSSAVIWDGAFIDDSFGRFMKLLALCGALVSLLLSREFMAREGIDFFEFPVLILLATLGMLMLISAQSLIALYLGLELMSLALYVIAAFHRDNLRASEAGLKYFVLGALSSGMMLYGASLIYGFAGTVSFTGIGEALRGGPSIGIVFGLVFLMAGLAFKMSVVPFHMWTPDVYEGAPTPVTAFFASAAKMAAVAITVRIVITAFPGMKVQWQQIVVFISILSMAVGAFGAIGQTNIKRLMAYSSIGHMGFALVGLSAGTQQGVLGVLVYLAIYLVMTLGTFAAILSMRIGNRYVENIGDLAGLSRNNKLLAFVLAMMMFSLAGIPPLAGFFAKWYVFVAAIQSNLYWLAVIGMLASVVSAFYYLRVVKIMYLDEPARPFDRVNWEVTAVMALGGLFVVLFWVYPGPLVEAASAAAKSLF
ncbi:NADH-quinone oxidoreductase subunit NuoN [Roseiarcaceae bacterium H3SJ34-1]|uniref:NADH-quinone oxidoreductase subunit NuoN n=1 Tax=Terripilifer ovatus TaxID=3032367 RepID=UPI003AB9604F|nr:NADH-quinone oxidoreductase subunit NuoN [Roseiarcaceae bacterium H3SJ34-1]